jgi:hypothetical protein
MALAAETHAAVCADVFDDVDHVAIGIAHDDHRALADHRADEVARLRQLGFERDITPVAAVEQALEFALIDGRVGVGPERNLVSPRAGPRR